MPMIDHEFLYTCFHPLQPEEFILCLERNIFPTELAVKNLKEVTYNNGVRTVKKKETMRLLNEDIIE